LNLSAFVWNPLGHAIELRVCAEDPTKDFLPSSGVIGEFHLPMDAKGARFETWVFRGCEVTSSFDSLILKVLQWGPSRSESTRRLLQTLDQVVVKGPPNNIPMLSAFLKTPMFATGATYTNTLSTFKFALRCVEVLGAGLSVTIQDYPGRTRRGLWRVGVPPSGPMDHFSARLANSLVGNSEDMAMLEVTVKGPSLKFHFDAVCAVTGAAFDVTVNGIKTPQHASFRVSAGDVLKVDQLASECGTRAYIAIRGGFDVPQYLGSRSTFIKGGFGGYQGRSLMAGDVLPIGSTSSTVFTGTRCLPLKLRPKMTKDWVIGVLPGPMANPDFMLDEDIAMLHTTKWSVHHNSNRLGVRLNGPSPKWTRLDGGEGGSHPSNIHDCEYAIGTINFTGDMPVIIGHDGPSLGGFVCPLTIATSHLWKIGQVKAGDTIRFELLSLQTAVTSRIEQNSMIETLLDPQNSKPPDSAHFDPCIVNSTFETRAVLLNRAATLTHPGMKIRLAGDSYILIEYGAMVLDIRLRIRIHALEEKLLEEDLIGMEETAPGVRSLQVRYDPTVLPLPDLCELVSTLDAEIEDLSSLQIKSRIFHLPLAWNHSGVKGALDQYMASIRAEAPYLPSNIDFVAHNNGVSVEKVVEKVYRASYMCLGLGDVYLGACCAVPTDPRDRLVVPKFNPARTYTQEGTVGLGGAYMCIYPMDSPGGYQLVGRTLPIWNTWGKTAPGIFSPDRPWMLEMFDQIRYYKVDEDELERLRQDFRNGSYAPKIEHSTFDAGKYDQFLESIADEVSAYQQQQRDSSTVQNELEKESLARLQLVESTNPTEGEINGSDELVLSDLPNTFEVVKAPVSSKVWSIEVKEGAVVSKNGLLLVLEAMKMEFIVKAGDGAASYTVHKLLVQQGQMVNLGTPIAVLQKIATVPNPENDTAVSTDDVQIKPSRSTLQIDGLLQLYRDGTATPTMIVNEIYDVMEARGIKAGNIWIDLSTRERSLQRAKSLESSSANQDLPLYGIPFAVKDNYDVEGWNTTAACPAFSYLPTTTAHCVQQLLDGGAIMIGKYNPITPLAWPPSPPPLLPLPPPLSPLTPPPPITSPTSPGKTNLDQFATGLNGTRSPYGACENAFNSQYISGGSSSGSAVACALGLCSFSLGTDTAGSGRIPAALNNLVGLKPTRGRISCHGLIPACKSLDCPSIFALSARDAAKVLKVMEGYDAKDAFSRHPEKDLPAKAEFTFGVPSHDQLQFFGNAHGPQLFEEACSLLESIGGVRAEIDYRPFKEAADLLYEGPWVAERLAVIEDFMKEHPGAVLETTKSITNKGHSFSAVDVFRSMYRLEALKSQVGACWGTKMDFLVTPTAGAVYTIAEMQADPVQLNTNLGHYMNFMNLLDMTAVAIPTGFLPTVPIRMPFGITVSSPAYSDSALLELAARVQNKSQLAVGTTTSERARKA
jgi:urea carboxylase